MGFSLQILGVLRSAAPLHGLAGLVAASALMTGCGQKGPLFIATPPVAPAATAVSPAPSPAITPASPFNTSPASAASAPR